MDMGYFIIYISIDGVKFNGHWVNDTQDGFGIETWDDGCEYKGNYKDGMKKGKGEYSWPDGSKYIGNWENNNQDGHGIYIWPDQKNHCMAMGIILGQMEENILECLLWEKKRG